MFHNFKDNEKENYRKVQSEGRLARAGAHDCWIEDHRPGQGAVASLCVMWAEVGRDDFCLPGTHPATQVNSTLLPSPSSTCCLRIAHVNIKLCKTGQKFAAQGPNPAYKHVLFGQNGDAI